MTFAPPRPRLPLARHWGAEPAPGGLWRFSLWAPAAGHVSVVVEGRRTPLVLRGDGFHRATAPATTGEAYHFLVDGQTLPDPAARAQASADVTGPSRLVDPAQDHVWTHRFHGRPWDEAVLYELHIGTFTAAGTIDAATARLADLAALGITAILLMAPAHFPGARGWGDRTALPMAPHPAYGSPAQFRAFVDAAHGLGLMVLADMHWSTFPDRAPLRRAAPAYFDAEGRPDLTRGPLRHALIESALVWLSEFRLDGLRLADADRLADASAPHILTDLAARLHAEGFTRPVHLIAGDGPVRPERFTASESAPFRHAIHATLTGEGGTRDGLPALCSALVARHRPASAIHALQTAASIGARPFGERLTRLSDPRAVQVALALLLCQPATPLLFMGDETGERAPFHLFTDLPTRQAAALRGARVPPDSPIPDLADLLPDPNDHSTFAASRPFRRTTADTAAWRSLTAGLLAFRRDELLPLLRSGPAGLPRARATGPAALIAEWPCRAGILRLAASFGRPPAADPPEFLRPPRLCLGHVGRDDHAFALWIDRPRRARGKAVLLPSAEA